MGTHPIFESDFDCLTEVVKMSLCRLSKRLYSTSRVAFKYTPANGQKQPKETWEEYIQRLEPLDRQELEKALRKHRREFVTNIDMLPKDARFLPPSRSRCQIVFIYNFVPFVFFGFLDNFLMILFGDAIEGLLSTSFPLSTMACAGLGNLFSDACGIGAAGYVEKFTTKYLGMKTPDLSAQEQQTTRAIWAKYGGQVTGIVIGCLIGMCPLLFIKHDEDSDRNEQQP